MPKGRRSRRLWLSVVRRTPLANNKTLRLDDNKGVVVSYNLLPETAAEHAFDILWALADGTVLSDCTELVKNALRFLANHEFHSLFMSTLTYTKEQAPGARTLYYEKEK
jgi:hypothetical protein